MWRGLAEYEVYLKCKHSLAFTVVEFLRKKRVGHKYGQPS